MGRKKSVVAKDVFPAYVLGIVVLVALVAVMFIIDTYRSESPDQKLPFDLPTLETVVGAAVAPAILQAGYAPAQDPRLGGVTYVRVSSAAGQATLQIDKNPGVVEQYIYQTGYYTVQSASGQQWVQFQFSQPTVSGTPWIRDTATAVITAPTATEDQYVIVFVCRRYQVGQPFVCGPSQNSENLWTIELLPKACTTCGGSCVNLQTDMNNCGTCGNVCSSTQTCVSGSCVTQCLPKTCADFPNQCGSVSNGCGGTVTCSCVAGQSCMTNGQCTTAGCTGGVACGNTCCNAGQKCYSNQCCAPKIATQACQGIACGNVSDGCGGYVSCGTCSTGKCSTDISTPTNNATCIVECTSNAQCQAGKLCKAGVCSSCQTNAECGPGFTCTSGTCTTTQNCNTCTAGTSRCDPANASRTQQCVAANGCTSWSTSTDCGAGKVCSAGVCQSSAVCAAPDLCTTTAPAGSVQVSGSCTTGSCYRCPSPTTYCFPSNSCRNLQTDANNCGTCGTICSSGQCVGGVCTSGPAAALGSFRYLRIETTENAWVSWFEVELYDQNNNKITPVTATASSYWYTQVPSLAIDGNLLTAWNSGETTCPSSTCPGAVRSAWIMIDLGSPKAVSRVRMLQSSHSITERDVLLVGNSTSVLTPITTLQATATMPFFDYQWVEYPQPAETRPAPTATITVNGKKDITLTEGEGVHFELNSQNGDVGRIIQTITSDSSLLTLNNIPPCSSSWSFIEGLARDQLMYGLTWDGFVPKRMTYSSTAGYCMMGKVHKITYRVTQRNGRYTEDTVTLRVMEKPTNQMSLGGAGLVVRPGGSASAETGGSGINLVSGGSYYYAWPTRLQVSVPPGLSVVLVGPYGVAGTSQSTPGNAGYYYNATVTASSTIVPGIYYFRVLGRAPDGNTLVADWRVRVDTPVGDEDFPMYRAGGAGYTGPATTT